MQEIQHLRSLNSDLQLKLNRFKEFLYDMGELRTCMITKHQLVMLSISLIMLPFFVGLFAYSMINKEFFLSPFIPAGFIFLCLGWGLSVIVGAYSTKIDGETYE